MILALLKFGLLALTSTPTQSSTITTSKALGTRSTFAATTAANKDLKSLQMSTRLDSLVGTGSFISNSNSDAPYYSSSITMSPSWKFSEALSISAEFALIYEWTAWVTPCYSPGTERPASAPAANCSDSDDPNGRRLDWTDLRISVQHDKLYQIFNVHFSGGGGISLPLSRASIATNNLLSLDVQASAERQLGPITLNLSVGGDQFFAQANASGLDAADISSDEIPIGHCPGFRQTNCILLSGFVPKWRLKTGFDLSVSMPIKGLSAEMGLSYAYTTRHSKPPDEFSSTATDQSGRRIVDGVNASDTTAAYFELAYELQAQWSLSAGISSGQPAKTEDGQSIRFPFYDFISPANNYSGFYLSLTHSL